LFELFGFPPSFICVTVRIMDFTVREEGYIMECFTFLLRVIGTGMGSFISECWGFCFLQIRV
jgi:hypothetical protein